MKKIFFIKVAAMISILVLAWLVPSVYAQTKEKFIKIGLSSGLSGPFSGWGIPWSRAMEILADQTNEAGINVKGEKYKIKVFPYDDKYGGAEAAIIAKRFVDPDKVLVACYIGGDGPLAARETLAKAGVIQFGLPFDPRYPDPAYPLSFASFMRYPECMAAAYDWVQKRYPAVKKVAQISPNNASGRGAKALIEKHWSELGIELLSVDLVEPAAVDFTAILTRVLGMKPDLISVSANPPKACGLIVKQARDLGYKGLFIHYVATDLSVIREIAGPENAEGFIGVMVSGKPLLPIEEKFKGKYIARYGSPFPDFALSSYVGFQLLVEAIKASRSLEPGAIAETMRSGKKFDTMWGKGYYGGKAYYGIDNQIIHPIPISTLKGGEILLLDKLDFPGYRIRPWAEK